MAISKIPPPFKHQKKSTKVMLAKPRVLDGSDPGTGKTRVQVDVFAARHKHQGGSALVLSPKSTLRSVWEADFKKFAPHIRLSIAPAERREAAFNEPADVYITNIDATTWLAKQPARFFKRFHTLIIDEISHYKHRTSDRSKALNKIKKHFKFRYGLTGTPNTRSITDVWHQIFLLDDGQRLGKAFFQFRASVCEPQQKGPMPNMIEWVDKPGAELAVAHLMQDIVVRHKFEECVDIPENHTYTVPYHMSAKQEAIYKEMEAQAIAELHDGRIISTVNAAGTMGKLLQIASGASYYGTGIEGDDPDAKYALIDSGRYELVADLAAQRKHSVVFFNWSHQRDLLLQEFVKRDITCTLIDGTVSDKKRNEAVKNFQSGFFQVLLAHPQSAAHGLTLTKGTTTIWTSPTHNLEHFLQGNRRIYRAGQTQKTETILIHAPNTVEDRVYSRLQEKDARQTSMLNLLKDLFYDKTKKAA